MEWPFKKPPKYLRGTFSWEFGNVYYKPTLNSGFWQQSLFTWVTIHEQSLCEFVYLCICVTCCINNGVLCFLPVIQCPMGIDDLEMAIVWVNFTVAKHQSNCLLCCIGLCGACVHFSSILLCQTHQSLMHQCDFRGIKELNRGLHSPEEYKTTTTTTQKYLERTARLYWHVTTLVVSIATVKKNTH